MVMVLGAQSDGDSLAPQCAGPKVQSLLNW
ncbi:hypothetical protein F0726_00963 [Acidithiobacillus caldus]|nr:hypothetical protein F0726_00963 [Acidithiobacillus caldus]